MREPKYNILPDNNGFYGNYGGQFINEELQSEFKKICEAFLFYKDDSDFNNELNQLLANYAGRPSPLYFEKNLC